MGMTLRPVLALLAIVFSVLISTATIAGFYPYDEKITISDSDGSYLGYVLPYQKEVFFVDYSYLKWKREGLPEANGFPIALIEGTTVPLPFGLKGEIVNVKINDISTSGIDMTIDSSDLMTEIEKLPETLPENIVAISNDIKDKTSQVVDEVDAAVSKFVGQIISRSKKFFERGYHSSLHILGSRATPVEKQVDSLIRQGEVDFAEKIADRIIPLIIDLAIAGGFPAATVSYSAIIAMIPSSVRHDMTAFIYNIGTSRDSEYSSDIALSKGGATTIFIGHPDHNKYSDNLNDELKQLGLPYFENGKIIGRRAYTEDSIGLIAAIPEEKVWNPSTIEERWEEDRIRFYKTMIAGIGDEGTEAAGKWYLDQLENAQKTITSFASLVDGAEVMDILSAVGDNFNANPKSTISSATLLQGWVLAGISTLQAEDFEDAESLGYVAVVKAKGTGYEVLEIHTINGYTKNSFLNPYEFVEEIEEVSDAIKDVSNLADQVEPLVEDLTGGVPMVTGQAIKDITPITRQYDNKEGDTNNPVEKSKDNAKNQQNEGILIRIIRNIMEWFA